MSSRAPRPGVSRGTGRVGAVLVAAGRSVRMGVDKLWESLGEGPLVSHALRCLAASARLDQIVFVASRERLADARALVDQLGISADVCAGGSERRHSVEAGLERLIGCTWVVVHDGARPFLTERMIEEGLRAAGPSGAAVAGVPAKDTIKRVADSVVLETLRRDELWLVQTPQVFRLDLLRSALDSSANVVTDEAMLVESIGGRVRIFPGAETNWKITTPPDLELARAWLSYSTGVSAQVAAGPVAPATGR